MFCSSLPLDDRLEHAWPSNLSQFRRPQLELSEPEHDHAVLRCSGELDGAIAPRLRSLLGEACERQAQALLIDLSDVELIDARVLALIEGTQVRLRSRRIPLRIVAGGQPMRLLLLTGLAERIAVLPSRPSRQRTQGNRFPGWPGTSPSFSSPIRTSVRPGAATSR